MWWMFSVLNTLVAVWKVKSFEPRHRKAFFIVQLTLSILVPGVIIAVARLRGLDYAKTTFYAVMCTPSSISSFFYAIILPSTIIVWTGTVMSGFVIYRLYQV